MCSVNSSGRVFIGRAKELDQFHEAAWQSKFNKVGSLFSVWGIRGIGKTALLKEVCKGSTISVDEQTIALVATFLSFSNLNDKKNIIVQLVKSLFANENALHVLQKAHINLSDFEKTSNADLDAAKIIEKIFAPVALEHPLLFAFDDFHFLENSNVEVSRWFLDEVVSPLVHSAKAIVILSGRFSIGNNPNIDASQRVKLVKLPTAIKLEGLSMDETRLMVREIRSDDLYSFNLENIGKMVFDVSFGHPAWIQIALSHLTKDGISSDYWDELDSLIRTEIIVGDFRDPSIQQERLHFLPVVERISILRQFSVGILEKLDTSELLRDRSETTPHHLIRNLLRTKMIEYSSIKGGYILDFMLHQYCERKLRHSDIEIWKKLHKSAFDVYTDLVMRYPSNPVQYLVELLYHALSLFGTNDFEIMVGEKIFSIKKAIHIEQAELLRAIENDSQIQALILSSSLKKNHNAFQGWLNNPRKGNKKMQKKLTDTFVSRIQNAYSKPPELIGDERKEQYAQILERIQQYPKIVVGIVGEGGIGKSDISKRIVNEFQGNFSKYQVIVPRNGIIELSVAAQRDPLYVMRWITDGVLEHDAIKKQHQKQNYFRNFNEQYQEHQDQTDLYNRVLRHRESTVKVLFDIWVEEYNELVLNENCEVLLSFDTVERLRKESVLTSYLEKMINNETGLKNTSFIIAGRKIEYSLESEMHKEESSFLKIKLNRLNHSDILDYLRGINVTLVEEDDKRIYYELTQGYPVIISLLASIAERMPEAPKQIHEQVKLIKDVSSKDIFLQICQKFVELSLQEVDANADPVGIFSLFLQARRGLSGKLISYIKSRMGFEEKNTKDCDLELRSWQVLFKPLVKDISSAANKSKELVIVAHDVIFEHAAHSLPLIDQADVREAIADFYRERRKSYRVAPNMMVDKPEYYLADLLDGLFYEYIVDPWAAFKMLSGQLQTAYYRGEISLMDRLWEEWLILKDDETIPPLGSETPSDEILLIEEGLLEIRKNIFAGYYFDAQDKIISLIKTIEKIIEVDENIQVNNFCEDTHLHLSVELCKVRLLGGDFSQSSQFNEVKMQLDDLVQKLEHSAEVDTYRQILGDAYSTCSYYWELTLKYDLAYRDILKAYSIYSQINNHTQIVRCQTKLSVFSLAQGKIGLAEEHYKHASALSVMLGENSLAKTLANHLLACLYFYHGNIRVAERILERLQKDDNSAGNYYRTNQDRMMLWRDATYIKSYSLILSMFLNDYLPFSRKEQGDGLETLRTWFGMANTYAKSSSDIFDLQFIKADFYLNLVDSLHLVPELNSDVHRKDFVDETKKAVNAMDSNKINWRFLGWRLLKYYLILGRTNLLQDNIFDAENAVISAREELARFENVFFMERRDALRRGERFFYDSIGEQYNEFFKMTAEVNLLSGHIIIKKSTDPKVSVQEALDLYEMALEKFLNTSDRLSATRAFDQVWQYLETLCLPPEELLKTVMLAFEKKTSNRTIEYLQDNIRLRCQRL